ncbi:MULTISPECIES: aldehyde dehydrogenase family protein [unclassified Enterococcus]|uniref:aldehyde dehydrogenase family protein n=1 Tax=unclassified Enterococcus TaxID=2608891 RepID=UPI00155621DD|nr:MULTISPECIES: aldehyde dehydrogenase family protein [unclassified Enterococcus]MBS7576425.1 aldehyde dehydrogenase family protein [Enterococcus sp. MMGLQ5-2]MBS7583657.1 aldehyde dehydrogenase family protein [Enterococcus sp. MMGLQ5-1]NPD11518.1 aldehyde dehydrogenase family protein [Enterococcus sp. MMGLQ5-1]NPD36262.1 aldehyde dehydrogenase family protein [Enterococcus sp. MMGLQ5-2]
MVYQITNPYTNQIEKVYSNQGASEIEAALQKGDQLYKSWRNTSFESRAANLNAVSQLFKKKVDEIATVITRDMGKRFIEAQGEVLISAEIAQYYADHASEFMAVRPFKSRMGDAQLVPKPIGVLMAVEPWNFPIYQLMRVFAPNYILGNPMLYKHASNTPGSAEVFAELLIEAGVEVGACTNLFIDYEQVNQIIADKRIQGVALTGSERAGALIAAEAGKNLKRSSLELGGSDPFVILHDADLSEIEKIVGQARLYNAGQVCTSSKRFIVTNDNYEAIVKMLSHAFSKAVMGDPFAATTTLAPLSSLKAKKDLVKQVEAALSNGATLAYGDMSKNQGEDCFFSPVILTDITPGNPAYYQEFFGPVGQIYQVADDDAAIALANDSNYGLSGVLFSGDLNRGIDYAKRIETGGVFVNSYGGTLPELPFGGVKRSGYGHELSELGFEAFMNPELIVARSTPIDLDNAFGGFL